MDTLFNGLSIASVLLLVALGLTFTFGQMGVINMAHGEFIMFGAYTPYAIASGFSLLGIHIPSLSSDPTVAFLLAIPVGFVVAGGLGVLLEALLLRRMYGRPLDTLLVTFGVSLVLQQLARDLFGAQNVDVKTPGFLKGSVSLGTEMPLTRLFIMALVLAVLAGVSVMLSKSPQGRRMRAVMQNRDLAEISGINSRSVDRATFFLGSGLAGIAGVAVSQIGSIGSALGTNYIIDAFLVVIVGGLGKLRGTIIAALAIGLLNVYSETWTSSSIGKAIVLVAVILFLQFRPNGIVSFRTRGLTA